MKYRDFNLEGLYVSEIMEFYNIHKEYYILDENIKSIDETEQRIINNNE
jgi:hypothetical protein